MSEEPKITSVEKTKDPRRVEAGKRLGMISKQAKERKALERSEVVVDVSGKNEWIFPASGYAGVVLVGAITGLVLYYGSAYSKKYKTVGTVGTVKSEETGPTGIKDETGTVSETKPKRVYKELDTLD